MVAGHSPADEMRWMDRLYAARRHPGAWTAAACRVGTTSARPLYEQALAIHRATLGAQHPDTATSMGNLGELLYAQGELAAARPLYEQALAIWRAVLGEQHPDTATCLHNLAALLKA